MRAALITRYGPPEVVTVGEAPKPVPGPGELLVRVHATATAGSLRLAQLRLACQPKPRSGEMIKVALSRGHG
jgi:hypothetical protein